TRDVAPAPHVRLGVLRDELPGEDAVAASVGLSPLGAAAALVGLVLGDDVDAQGALAVDDGSGRARRAEGQRLTDDRIARDLLAAEVDRSEPELGLLALLAAQLAEAQRPGLGAGWLDDQVEAFRPGVGYLAAVALGGVLAHGGVGEDLAGHCSSGPLVAAGTTRVPSGWRYGVLRCMYDAP